MRDPAKVDEFKGPSLRSLIRRPIRKLCASMSDLDAWWAGYAISVPGFAGSWLGFLYFGAGIWAVVSVLLRRFPICIPVRSRFFAGSCVGYALVLFFASVANDGLEGVTPGLAAGAAFYFVPFLYSRLVVSSPRRSIDTMLQYAPLGALMCLVIALYQLFLQSKSIEGGAGNPSVFGYVSAILGAISYNGIKSLKDIKGFISIVGFVAGMCALLFSGTRTLYPFVAFIPLMHYFLTSERSVTFRFGTALFPIALVVILLATFSGKILHDVSMSVEEIAQIGGEPSTGSLGIRLELWKAGIASIAEAPWLGHGQLHKMDGVNSRLPDIISYTRFSHAHNIFIDNSLSGGIFAVIFLLFVLFSPLFMIWHISFNDPEVRIKYCVFMIVLISISNGLLNVLFTHDIVSALFLFTIVVLGAGVGFAEKSEDLQTLV